METTNEIHVASYDQQVQHLKKELANLMPPEIASIFANDAASMGASSIGSNALLPGTKAPEFALPDFAGNATSLSDAIAKGNVVLTFYRGIWCPYCNLQLKIYQDMLPQIKAMGATLIAVSPMTPDNSLSMKEKHALEFTVLSDLGNKVAKQYGIIFNLPDTIIETALKVGVDIPKFNGTDQWQLPIPATFIIDKEGIIRHTFVDGDYTKRIEPKEVLDVLSSLK